MYNLKVTLHNQQATSCLLVFLKIVRVMPPCTDAQHRVANIPTNTGIHRRSMSAVNSPIIWIAAVAVYGLCCASPAVAAPSPKTAPAPAASAGTYLPAITVSGIRYGAGSTQLPSTSYSLGRRRFARGRRQVNLSESLGQVPGVLVQNRYDYAEGEQVSIRGFGATAPFGVQGVRLIVDGIPATMPDGQGEPQIIDLPSAGRIDVIEGPFSALYGNAAGGVILVHTRNGPRKPTIGLRSWAGSFGSHQTTLYGGATSGPANYFTSLSRFHTRGWRDHSSATRTHFNAKLRYSLGAGSSLTVIANALYQQAQDPSGLSQTQMEQNPRQARSAVYTYDTRKTVHNTQGGVVWQQQLGHANTLHVSAYNGQRSVLQFLPFSGDFGLSSGGVVDLADYFGGGNARVTHQGILAGVPYSLSVGTQYERENEFRKGYVNNNGTQGALRRNEFDVVDSFAQFAQTRWLLTPRWSLAAGLRHSTVRFNSTDHFITATNPNDSGSATYSSNNPVLGFTYKATSHLHVYFDYGRGFQTPTFYQLAYRPDGNPGLNFSLKPMRSDNYEVGTRLDSGRFSLNASVFHILTHNEIVVAASTNGRTSYMNAGETKRNGAELAFTADITPRLSAHLAYSYLDATFVGGPYDGSALPGVPKQRALAGLRWTDPGPGFYTDLDFVAHGRAYANSQNSASAAGYGLVNWGAGFRQHLSKWHISEFLRVDNILDRRYVSALVIGDSYGHYYEPGPGRDITVGFSLRRSF